MSSISAWGGGLPPHPGPKQGTLFIPMTGSQGPSSDLRGKMNAEREPGYLPPRQGSRKGCIEPGTRKGCHYIFYLSNFERALVPLLPFMSGVDITILVSGRRDIQRDYA
jgi:hypothetical protein